MTTGENKLLIEEITAILFLFQILIIYFFFLQLDQPGFILPGRTYYLEESQTFQQMKEAYVTYASKVAALFGADEAMARSAMQEVLIFETELANVRQ